MAGRGLGSLTLDLIAKIGGFTGPMGQAERDLDKRTRAMEKRAQAFAKSFNSAFGGLALKLGSFIGGFFAVNKAVDGFFSSIDRADAMRDLSIQLGIGVKDLSELAYAAQQSGVDIDTLGTSLKFLEKNAAAALNPKSRQRGLFDAILGKGKADLEDTQHLLSQLADAFSKMEDTPARAALELELFGKSGLKMAEFLKQGSTEIDKLRARAEELGVTIDQGTADAADKFNDKLADVKSVAAGLGTQIASALMPQVERLLDWMIEFGTDPGNVEKLVKDTTDAFNNFATAIESVYNTAAPIYNFLDGLHGKLQDLEKAGQDAGYNFWSAFAPDGGTFQKMLDQNRKALQGLGTIGANGEFNAKGPAAFHWIDPPAAGPAKPKSDPNADKRIRDFLAGNTEATNKNAEAKRRAAEAAREQKRREEELAEAVKKATEAQAEFDKELEDLIAHQGGPLAESALKYRREEEELRKTWAEGSTPSAEKLTQALNALHAARDADAEAIRKQIDTGGEQLKQMQQELDLLNMQTKAERDRAAFLLDNPTATGAQADQAVQLQAALDQTHEAISAMDEFRGEFQDNVKDVITGAESIGDAFEDMADAVIDQLARMVASSISDSLFGAMGTTGAGSTAGGGIFSWLSAFLPKHAAGTNFAPGGLSLVGERGPELVNLPRGSQVVPADATARMLHGGPAIGSLHITVPAGTSRDTADQIAAKVGLAVQRAMARNF